MKMDFSAILMTAVGVALGMIVVNLVSKKVPALSGFESDFESDYDDDYDDDDDFDDYE